MACDVLEGVHIDNVQLDLKVADSVNSFCCIASKSQLLCYSFVFRRRDAVVSRAVWKKITDLQRVLNFRKIRIFDRFTNFTQFHTP